MNNNMDDNLDNKPFDLGGLPNANVFSQQQNGTDPQQSPQQPQLSLFYPLPPMRYIKQYTDVNVRNRTAPPPPKPITNGSYLMFGQNITIDDTIIRSLESQGLRRLYPREYDHKRELKKINASILVNFLDLIDVLIRCPDTLKRVEKCNDLQLLFITMHHLINELRPHQARESIRMCLKMQKIQRQETSKRLLKQIDRVQDIIRTSIQNIKNKDISILLQEIKPENFGSCVDKNSNQGNKNAFSSVPALPIIPPINITAQSMFPSSQTNRYETLSALLSENDDSTTIPSTKQRTHQTPITSSSTIASKPTTDSENKANGYDQKDSKSSSKLSKMSEMDAFMCDLVDETFGLDK